MLLSELLAVLRAQWSACCLLLEGLGQEERQEAMLLLARVTLGQEGKEETRETYRGVEQFLVGLGQALASGQLRGTQEIEPNKDDWQKGAKKDELHSFDGRYSSEPATKSVIDITKQASDSPSKCTSFIKDVYTRDKISQDVKNTILPSFELPNIFFKKYENIFKSTEEEFHLDDSLHKDQSEDLNKHFSAQEGHSSKSSWEDNDNKEPKANNRGAKKTGVKREKLKTKYIKDEIHGKRFFCVMCEQAFRRLARMLNHVDKKHGPKPGPTCDNCGVIFETYGKMDYHRGIMHGNRVSCTECGKVFPVSQLQDHMSNTHEVCEPISCEICGVVFTNRRKLKMHRKGHDGPRIKYDKVCINKFKENCFCQIYLPNKRSKIEHYKLVHKQQKQCPKCDRIVKDIQEIAHRCEKKPVSSKPRSKAVKCPICGKVYTKNTSYWYHRKSAHNNEPVGCEVCGKLFQSHVNKKEHFNKMHKEKMACQTCGKLVLNLKVHIENKHTEEADMKFKCKVCSKGLPTIYKFNEHTRIHSGERPHKCREGCEMAFTDKSNRNQHKRRVQDARGGVNVKFSMKPNLTLI